MRLEPVSGQALRGASGIRRHFKVWFGVPEGNAHSIVQQLQLTSQQVIRLPEQGVQQINRHAQG